MGVAIGDYNHTGRFSIYVTNFADEFNTLYRNDGDYNFTDVSYDSGVALPSLPYVKWGTAFVDLDNDGWADLISTNGHVYPQVDSLPSGARYREPMNLLMNQADGTFCDAQESAGVAVNQPRVGRGLAVADFFNRGQMDVIVENLDGEPVLLENPGVAGNHWVTFELAGTKSNRLALGARVTIQAGEMRQTDEVRSGGSYLSQNDLRVHFGLGRATRIDSVVVHWPSGAEERLENLPVDQFLGLKEGKGLVPLRELLPSKP
jgi:hypothetical protein